MNIISSLFNREIITVNSKLKIIWTPSENKYFTKFIETLGHNLLDMDSLYFGNIIPNLIICNNKVFFYEQVRALSIRYHIPILVVDHNLKKDIFDNQKILTFNDFPCSYHIAINKEVYDSWGRYHHQILDYDIKNKHIWINLIYQISKRVFIYE